MPASSPVTDAKQFPAAAMEDQDEIAEGRQEVTVMGTPPFSSPDPVTDSYKMLPLEDGTSAHQGALEAAETRSVENNDYNALDKSELQRLADERDLSVEGSGKDGNVVKKDLVAALLEDDASDMKAADFKSRVEAASTQDELDAAANLYGNSGKSFSSVEAAIEKKQSELEDEDA